MIKKTFETIRKNPIIILFFGIVFAMLLVTRFINVKLLDGLLLSSSIQLDYLLKIYTRMSLVNYTRLFFQAIFIFAPILYYIYIHGNDEPQKGWYIKGVRHGWWKYLLFAVVLSHYDYMVWQGDVFVSYFLLHDIKSTPISEYIDMSLPFMYGCFFNFLLYYLIAPMIVEKNFRSGYSSIFTLAKNYFWKLLGVYTFCQIVVYAISGGAQYLLIYRPGIIIFSSLATAATSMFLYTYSMNLYISERQKRETKAIEENIQESKLDDQQNT